MTIAWASVGTAMAASICCIGPVVGALAGAGVLGVAAVSGMTCSGCAVAVQPAAKAIDGVTEVIVSYEEGEAQVTFDPAKTTLASIGAAITQATGFKTAIAIDGHGSAERDARTEGGGS